MKTNRLWNPVIKIIAVFVLAMVMLCFIPLTGNNAYADSEVVKTVDVTLHANGGKFKAGGYGVIDENTCLKTFTVYDTGDVSFVNVDMRPEWEGKMLIGWSTDKNAQWETYSEWFEQISKETGMYEFALPMDGSVTDLYAVFTDLYNITLDANGGNFGTITDRYGNVSYIETFEAELWNIKNGVAYHSVPDVLINKSGVQHVGWSRDKNARIPEYESPGSFVLNADTPKVMYAVFGDPDAGETKIVTNQTKFDVNLKGSKTGRIDYTVEWTGVVNPNSISIDIKPQGDISGILKYTDEFDWEFKLADGKYVCKGWVEYEAKKAGTAKLDIIAELNGKEAVQTITFNVTDGNSGEGSQSNNSGSNDQKDNAAKDRTKQKGADGTSLGKGASAEAANKAITSMKSDADLPGSVFRKIQLRSSAQYKNSITLKWKKVSGAKKYVIYANKCGKTTKFRKLSTVKSTAKATKTIKKVAGKKLKKGTYYKFMIVALDKNNNVVSSSKIIHVATKGGKVGNVGKITTKAKKNKVSIKKGKTFKLKAKQVAVVKKLSVKKHRVLKYETTNKKIATVSSKGVIKGKKKGTCYVYVYAQNGVFAKIKVTVK